MKELIANRRLSYAGAKVQEGERFSADDKHAVLLCQYGSAREPDPLPAAKQAKAKAPAKAKSEKESSEKGYARRDMRAEA